MARRSGQRTRRPVLLALTGVVVVLAAGCASTSDGSGGPDAAGWIAADLGSVPEGLEIDRVEERSSDGRMVGYRAVDRGPYGDDGWQVQVVARVPMEWSVAEILEAYREVPAEEAVGDIETEVHGHRAVVVPSTDDGREYGWEVIWEEAPGVQIHLTDVRRSPEGVQTATREGALALAEGVRGLDGSAWIEALGVYEATTEYVGPAAGAVEREVADGVLDARQWTLSVLEDPASTLGIQSCFRLAYAGEDTGPGCSVQRVVLGGKGFVMGWTGQSDEAPELLPGPGSSFDPIRPQVHAFGSNPDIPESHVWIAVLPDGACGVEYRHPLSSPMDTPIPVNLLPGDPGAVECSIP